MFKNKSILITGGTGSFGTKFVEMTLKKYNPDRLIIYSRDEMKQWEMEKKFSHEKSVRFYLGDVRDKDRLKRALDGVDIVIHAAAVKIVPTAEYNPFEFVKTNINGAMNVVDTCIDMNVEKVIALSTDKACLPINLYGASKLASDKLFIAGNIYSARSKTRFSVVRYGNVMGSRGSILPFYLSLDKNKPFPITDNRMTRFMISLEDGVKLVWHAIQDMDGGEIYVKKIPSMKVTDIAKAVDKDRDIKIIGIRPGEKLHEQMISKEDAMYTLEYKDYFKIYPPIHGNLNDIISNKEGSKNKGPSKVSHEFEYKSDTNKQKMSVSTLQEWIKLNMNNIGKI